MGDKAKWFNDDEVYNAKSFRTQTACGSFKAAGTRCGHIDFVVPGFGTFPLSPEETERVIYILEQARNFVQGRGARAPWVLPEAIPKQEPPLSVEAELRLVKAELHVARSLNAQKIEHDRSLHQDARRWRDFKALIGEAKE